MPYVRLSLMKPMSGKDLEVANLNQELVEFYRRQEGCVSSHVITAVDSSGEVGRVSVWESEGTADAAATADRSLSLRSRLHLLLRRGHQDRSFRSD